MAAIKKARPMPDITLKSPMRWTWTSFVALLFLGIASHPRPLEAQEFNPRSFGDLTHYVEVEAGAAQLASLARRQFYFEVTSNHEAAAEEYSRMQQAIARTIPVEFERPVFDVRFVFGDESAANDQNTVGVLGVTGPLSDANIVQLVMELLNPADVANGTIVHLFSLPPPRTTWDQFTAGALYAARVTRFLRHAYANYFLASNTAYLNFKTIERIAGAGRVRHLPRIIVDQIAAMQARESRRETLLILGTRQAWDGRLYDSILDEKELAYARLSLDHQVALQAWIDRIKQGRLTDEQSIQLKSFLASLGRQYGANGLLLSCTELPLGLGAQAAALENEGFVVHDSEAMIAEIIAEVVQDPALGDTLAW